VKWRWDTEREARLQISNPDSQWMSETNTNLKDGFVICDFERSEDS